MPVAKVLPALDRYTQTTATRARGQRARSRRLGRIPVIAWLPLWKGQTPHVEAEPCRLPVRRCFTFLDDRAGRPRQRQDDVSGRDDLDDSREDRGQELGEGR